MITSKQMAFFQLRLILSFTESQNFSAFAFLFIIGFFSRKFYQNGMNLLELVLLISIVSTCSLADQDEYDDELSFWDEYWFGQEHNFQSWQHNHDHHLCKFYLLYFNLFKLMSNWLFIQFCSSLSNVRKFYF
jgi:hypothetical protein